MFLSLTPTWETFPSGLPNPWRFTQTSGCFWQPERVRQERNISPVATERTISPLSELFRHSGLAGKCIAWKVAWSLCWVFFVGGRGIRDVAARRFTHKVVKFFKKQSMPLSMYVSRHTSGHSSAVFAFPFSSTDGRFRAPVFQKPICFSFGLKAHLAPEISYAPLCALCYALRVDMLVNRYTVVSGDATSLLDVDGRSALDVGDGGYFRRYSTNPTQDADTDLAEAIAAGKLHTKTRGTVSFVSSPTPYKNAKGSPLAPFHSKRFVFSEVCSASDCSVTSAF